MKNNPELYIIKLRVSHFKNDKMTQLIKVITSNEAIKELGIYKGGLYQVESNKIENEMGVCTKHKMKAEIVDIETGIIICRTEMYNSKPCKNYEFEKLQNNRILAHATQWYAWEEEPHIFDGEMTKKNLSNWVLSLINTAPPILRHN